MALPKFDIKTLTDQIRHFIGFSKKTASAKATRRIGLDIGHSHLVASELVWNENEKPVLERIGSKPIVSDQPLVNQIKTFYEESGFKSKLVNTSVKGQGVVIRFLSFPKMSRSEFASSIRYEAEKYLPFSLAEVEYDYHIVSQSTFKQNEDGTTMPVILVAARKTEVQSLIQTLQAAGLKINLIDMDMLACSNAFQQSNPVAKEHCVALIDFGAVDSSLAIIDKGTLVFSRDIAFGGNDLTELIHRKLNISLEEAFQTQMNVDAKDTEKVTLIEEGLGRLFQEIKSSITYYYNQHNTQNSLETIYISGGFSQLNLLPQLLEQQLSLPVSTWNPTDQLIVGDTVDRNALAKLVPYLPVSIGLALRAT